MRSSPAGGVVSITGVSAHDKDGERRTLEQRGDADDDLYGVSEGGVEQARERLPELERELFCRGS